MPGAARHRSTVAWYDAPIYSGGIDVLPALRRHARAGVVTLLASLLPVLAVAQAPAPAPTAPGFLVIESGELKWQSAGGDGIQFALLHGNPNQPGIYIMRVRFPAGAMSRPHTHDRDRYITVIEGTWHAGTQAKFDPAATRALGPGSFMVHPAGAVHYDGARDVPTIVEIRGMGPVATKYVQGP